MMKRLEFKINTNRSVEQLEKLIRTTTDLKHLANRVGTGSHRYLKALKELTEAARYKRPLQHEITNRVLLRALPAVLRDYPDVLTKEVLEKVDALAHKPSFALLEALTQFFFMRYYEAIKIPSLTDWLKKNRQQRGIQQPYDEFLFSSSGAKWAATSAIEADIELNARLKALRLDLHATGDFKQASQNIYYLEQLKKIDVNRDHNLLKEIVKPSVVEAPYAGGALLGHEILSIVIDRANANAPHQAWQDVVIKIAGDPRVSPSSSRYQKWWQHIDNKLIAKVRSWLSKYELRLFLEALNDFKESTNNTELMRMYPARKKFMEGLLDKELVLHTRLFLSRRADQYLKKNYEQSALTQYEVIDQQDKSLIYIQLDGAHLIEGSHSCYLWIYKNLISTACVYNYSRKKFAYFELTQALAAQQVREGMPKPANITHSPNSWQRHAVAELRNCSVDIVLKDVIDAREYDIQRRLYGVS